MRHDRARTVLLRLRDRLRLFSTQTTDFESGELLAIKDRYGQLYADVSRKLAPDDFERDLRKLRRWPGCASCHRRVECAGAWESAPGNVFAADEQRLLALLGDLRGDVLDVGCGEAPYLRALEQQAQAGSIRYLGIDPDSQRLAVLASRHAWARFRALSAELVSELEMSFDHVLILRSFNHLREPRAAVQALLRCLRPGGTLTLVDNVAFGLLREARTARRAETGPAEHEHYRNADAETALKLLEGLPLRVLEKHEVSPDSSNQWLLHLAAGQTPIARAAPSGVGA